MSQTLKKRNRELRTVRISEIRENPLNFRLHPSSQKLALSTAIQEIGWFGYPDVFEASDGSLVLVDGALRREWIIERYGPDAEITVNVTDFSESEARIALASKDPIAALALADEQVLRDLLRDIASRSSIEFRLLLESLAREGGIEVGDLVVPDMPVLSDVDTIELENAGYPIVMAGHGRHHLWLESELVDDQGGPGEAAAGCPDGCLAIIDGDPGPVDYRPARVCYWAHELGREVEAADQIAETRHEIRAQLIWVRAGEPAEISDRWYTRAHMPIWYAVRKTDGAAWIGQGSRPTVLEEEEDLDAPWRLPRRVLARLLSHHGIQLAYQARSDGRLPEVCEHMHRSSVTTYRTRGDLEAAAGRLAALGCVEVCDDDV